MKTRNGFVSNSSSSSYVLFASDIYTFGEIPNKDIDLGLVYCKGDCGEGYDFFQVTSSIYDFLIQRIEADDERIENLAFKKVYYLQCAENSSFLKKEDVIGLLSKIPDNVHFFIDSFDVSYHSSSSVKDVRDRYFEGVELDNEEEIAKQYLALKKEMADQKLVMESMKGKLKDMSKKVNLKIVDKLEDKKDKSENT